jgi:geranylgeranyl diphosphate synthase type I
MMADLLIDLNAEMQKEIDFIIRKIIDTKLKKYPSDYRKMVDYQMGLDGQPGSTQSQGKRLRPLFVLLSCDLFDVDWHAALPSAAAVELLHNFSLVHDDIQDGSITRRGRETIWKKWGVAQAINVGDALLNLAFLAILDCKGNLEDKEINNLLYSLQNTCLLLTKGQHLDIAFEKETQIPLSRYWQMIEGKTAALISASFEIGSIVARAKNQDLKLVAEFGHNIGLAFQVQDDYLGIWGDEIKTGKPAFSDLVNRKKTYPVIRGLKNKLKFASSWLTNAIINSEIAREMAYALDVEGVREEVIAKYRELYASAWINLEQLNCEQIKKSRIYETVKELENRTR